MLQKLYCGMLPPITRSSLLCKYGDMQIKSFAFCTKRPILLDGKHTLYIIGCGVNNVEDNKAVYISAQRGTLDVAFPYELRVF